MQTQLTATSTSWVQVIDYLASPFCVARITGMYHHAELILVFCREKFLHVVQATLKVLTSGDPPSLASQSAGITGVSHRVWPKYGGGFQT